MEFISGNGYTAKVSSLNAEKDLVFDSVSVHEGSVYFNFRAMNGKIIQLNTQQVTLYFGWMQYD